MMTAPGELGGMREVSMCRRAEMMVWANEVVRRFSGGLRRVMMWMFLGFGVGLVMVRCWKEVVVEGAVLRVEDGDDMLGLRAHVGNQGGRVEL